MPLLHAIYLGYWLWSRLQTRQGENQAWQSIDWFWQVTCLTGSTQTTQITLPKYNQIVQLNISMFPSGQIINIIVPLYFYHSGRNYFQVTDLFSLLQQWITIVSSHKKPPLHQTGWRSYRIGLTDKVFCTAHQHHFIIQKRFFFNSSKSELSWIVLIVCVWLWLCIRLYCEFFSYLSTAII